MKDKIDRSVMGALGGIIDIFLPSPQVKIMNIAHLFIPQGQDHNLWGNILGYTAHFTVAALLGIIFINIFRITGRDWAFTKGIIFGAATWVLLHGITANLLDLPQQTGIPLAFALLGGHLVFGIITSLSIAWFSSKLKL